MAEISDKKDTVWMEDRKERRDETAAMKRMNEMQKYNN